MSKVLYDVASGIARITLNRPERRNALDQELLAEFRSALQRSAADQNVRVVLIAGVGKDFCSGMDLKIFSEQGADDLAQFESEARNMAGALIEIRGHPRPVVAAVQGRALGGGFGIATAADLVLAADTAQFGYPEINIGFVPAIVMALLRRLVSEKRAFELIALGEIIPAEAALDHGIINRIFSAETFDNEVGDFVGNLASKSSSALATCKELFYRTDMLPFETAVEAGAKVNALARTTNDFKQGIARFVKKP